MRIVSMLLASRITLAYKFASIADRNVLDNPNDIDLPDPGIFAFLYRICAPFAQINNRTCFLRQNAL